MSHLSDRFTYVNYYRLKGAHMMTIADIPDGSDAMVGAALAAEYHGGQFTALYALASAGNLALYPGEGSDRIIRELANAVVNADTNGYPEDAHYREQLLIWVRTNFV